MRLANEMEEKSGVVGFGSGKGMWTALGAQGWAGAET